MTSLLRSIAFIAIHLAATPHAPGAERPPNIVFFLVDDLGWSDTGCYAFKGGELVELFLVAAVAGAAQSSSIQRSASS